MEPEKKFVFENGTLVEDLSKSDQVPKNDETVVFKKPLPMETDSKSKSTRRTFENSNTQPCTPKDGNGFLHAILDQMRYDPIYEFMNISHNQLRMRIVKSLPLMIQAGKIDPFGHTQMWMDQMSKDGTYCDDIFIELASCVLNRRIEILSNSKNQEKVYSKSNCPFEPFLIEKISSKNSNKYFQSKRVRPSGLKLNKNLAKIHTNHLKKPEEEIKRTSLKRMRHSSSSQNLPEFNFKKLKYHDVSTACKQFQKENLIGVGSYGSVYKGQFYGMEIAVKKIEQKEKFQGTFNSYIKELSALHAYPAKNIISPMAISLQLENGLVKSGENLCLIYEYFPNGSLLDMLDMKYNSTPLTWDQRFRIAQGIARGLNYLHVQTPRILHGNIKSSKIYIDNCFEPKIGSCGLSRIERELLPGHVFPDEGYYPNEYLQSGKLNASVDIHCYGMVLFHLMTGKAPTTLVKNTSNQMREVIKTTTFPDYWYDKNVKTESWDEDFQASWLYKIGKDCTRTTSKGPKMKQVLEAFERLNIFMQIKKCAKNQQSQDQKIPQCINSQNDHESDIHSF